MTSHSAYEQYIPRRHGFNPRMIAFILAIAIPFIGIGYVIVVPFIRGAVVNRGSYSEVDLKALGNFPFDKDTGTVQDVPAQFRALDGKRVMLKGFMWSPRSAGSKGVEVEFVYNVTKCCFGGPPRVQERVFAHVPPGHNMDIYPQTQFVDLTGILHVRVVRDADGFVSSVYDMDVQKVNPES